MDIRTETLITMDGEVCTFTNASWTMKPFQKAVFVTKGTYPSFKSRPHWDGQQNKKDTCIWPHLILWYPRLVGFFFDEIPGKSISKSKDDGCQRYMFVLMIFKSIVAAFGKSAAFHYSALKISHAILSHCLHYMEPKFSIPCSKWFWILELTLL